MCPSLSLAIEFNVPKDKPVLIGTPQNVQVQPNEDYPTIAQRYDIGYYELYESNPGVDPDDTVPGTILIIPTSYILPPELNNNIVINLAEMRLYYQSAKLQKIFIFPIGIGKEGWNTPIGKFKIASKTKNPSWIAPKDVYQYRLEHGEKIPRIVPPGKDNPLGNYAMRLSNPSYLIHGTDDPVGVGRRSSAGCIRMYPQDIEKLFNMVDVGTEVTIINSPYKAAKTKDKVYLEAHMPLYEQRAVMHGDLSLAAETVKKLGSQNTTLVDWKKVEMVAKDHLGIPQLVSGSNMDHLAPTTSNIDTKPKVNPTKTNPVTPTKPNTSKAQKTSTEKKKSNTKKTTTKDQKKTIPLEEVR